MGSVLRDLREHPPTLGEVGCWTLLVAALVLAAKMLWDVAAFFGEWLAAFAR